MPEVGKWSPHEARVLIVFLLTAVAWMTRSGPFGGWKTWFGGGIAIAKAFIASGLSAALGEALSGLAVLHIVLILARHLSCDYFSYGTHE